MGNPYPSYTFALAETVGLLERSGIGYEVALYAGDCHVDDARNVLVRKFLDGDCTDLFFIDADMGWRAEDFLFLLECGKNVVAATYPYKDDAEGYPVAMLPGDAWAENGLVKVSRVPTGFLCIKRVVLEILAGKAEKFATKKIKDIPLIFERKVHNGSRRGGDYQFCYLWGEDVWLAPEIFLEHTGDKTWKGSYGHFCRVEMMGGIKAGLLEISEGMETENTFNDMFDAWGNKFAAERGILQAAVTIARTATKPILEFGTGLTTLCMAAANPNVQIVSLEHDEKWLELMKPYDMPNVRIIHAPLKDRWYTRIPKGDYSLVLCDGPPRALGDRWNVFKEIGDSLLVMDDCDDPKLSGPLIEWANANNRKFSIIDRVGICGHKS